MRQFHRKEEISDAFLLLGRLERQAAHSRQYGPCLTVQFIDRLDQVALKLYAAMDPTNGRRHGEDLVEMRPTKEEVRHGGEWLLAWKSNAAFKERLAVLIGGRGYSALAAFALKRKSGNT